MCAQRHADVLLEGVMHSLAEDFQSSFTKPAALQRTEAALVASQHPSVLLTRNTSPSKRSARVEREGVDKKDETCGRVRKVRGDERERGEGAQQGGEGAEIKTRGQHKGSE